MQKKNDYQVLGFHNLVSYIIYKTPLFEVCNFGTTALVKLSKRLIISDDTTKCTKNILWDNHLRWLAFSGF